MIIMKNKIIKILNQKLNIRSDGYCFITIPRYLNKKDKMITKGNFDIWMMPSNVEGSILKQITEFTSFRMGLENLLKSNLHCLKEYNRIEKEDIDSIDSNLKGLLRERIRNYQNLNYSQRGTFEDHSQIDFKNRKIIHHPYFSGGIKALEKLISWLKLFKGYEWCISSHSGWNPTHTIKIVGTPINKENNDFTKSFDEIERSKRIESTKTDEETRNYILKIIKKDFEKARKSKLDLKIFRYIMIAKYKDLIFINSLPIDFFCHEKTLKNQQKIPFNSSKNWNWHKKKILIALEYIDNLSNLDVSFFGAIPPMYKDRIDNLSERTNCPYCNEDITLKIYSEKDFKTQLKCFECKKEIKLGLIRDQIISVKKNENVPIDILMRFWGDEQ